MMGADGKRWSWYRSSGKLAEEVIQGADVVLKPGGSVRFTSGGGMPAVMNLDHLVKQANWPYGYIGSKVPWNQGGEFVAPFVSRNTVGKPLPQFKNQKDLFWYIFTLSP
ncbi:MAG: hypothetical protein JXB07_11910 [Anaerolineae bacterium]|nr:hypothetical protein [Anaerolineae bacterium]